jgi:hypothetical protein
MSDIEKKMGSGTSEFISSQVCCHFTRIEIGHDRNIYTMEISRDCQSGLPLLLSKLPV